jgi:hypothetical protein
VRTGLASWIGALLAWEWRGSAKRYSSEYARVSAVGLSVVRPEHVCRRPPVEGGGALAPSGSGRAAVGAYFLRQVLPMPNVAAGLGRIASSGGRATPTPTPTTIVSPLGRIHS